MAVNSPQFELVRVEIGPDGAFGVLKVGRRCFAVTIEHTYDPDNSVKIPPGEYICPRVFFIRGGYWTYEVPVIGHTGLLFHVANTEADVDGCIGVAKSFGMLGGIPGIVASRTGFGEFILYTGNADSISLTVR